MPRREGFQDAVRIATDLARKFMAAGEAFQRVTEWHRRHPML